MPAFLCLTLSPSSIQDIITLPRFLCLALDANCYIGKLCIAGYGSGLVGNSSHGNCHYGKFYSFTLPIPFKYMPCLLILLGIKVPYLGVELRYYEICNSV